VNVFLRAPYDEETWAGTVRACNFNACSGSKGRGTVQEKGVMMRRRRLLPTRREMMLLLMIMKRFILEDDSVEQEGADSDDDTDEESTGSFKTFVTQERGIG
jgi:hypothetical protein